MMGEQDVAECTREVVRAAFALLRRQLAALTADLAEFNARRERERDRDGRR